MRLTESAQNIIHTSFPNVRVGVRGGGCSGYQYVLEPCEPSTELDEICPGIWIDPISAMYLEGVTLDFIDAPFEKGFKFSNPGARTCGCGKSFSA
jgi:iron-sulfur cluster assembly accessory protein